VLLVKTVNPELSWNIYELLWNFSTFKAWGNCKNSKNLKKK